MALTDFTIIRRSMTTRLFSTVTTIATVAVAVALMLVLLSMRDSGRQAFERGSGNMHMLVSKDGSAMESILNGLFYAKPPQAYITWAEYQELLSAPRPLLRNAPLEVMLDYAIPMQQGDSYKGYPTLATTPEFFTLFKPAIDRGWELDKGAFFTTEFQVVAGATAARGANLRVGDSLALTHGSPASRDGGALSLGGGAAAGAPQPAPHVHDEFKFKVVGILKPTGTSHDRALFTNLNSSWILHAFDRIEREAHKNGDDHAHDDHDHDHDHDHGPPMTVADLTDADRLITGVLMRVATRPGADSSALLPQIFDMLRKDKSITVASPSDQIRKLFQIVGGINQILLAIAAAVVVSSGIAIMLALYNSMEQRRRQVAILRVLGCSRARVFGLILTESALIGVLGVIAGALLSFLAGMLIAEVLKTRLGMIVSPTYTLDWVLLVVVGTIALACIAGLVPAAMAYRTSVHKHLKPAT